MVNESPRKDPRGARKCGVARGHKQEEETEGHAQTQRKGIHDKKKILQSSI